MSASSREPRADLSLAMPDGATIVVPDDLRISTTYVLLEQHDWFEDEIRFLRTLVKPGMRAIDAGANFGVYTLALAKTVGPQGRVWAFEPGEEAQRYLARSIAANGFGHVDLLRCALSRADGSGFLQSGITPELRRLVASGSSAAVNVRALDSVAAERGITAVDFMKIDVEGEEANVLEGAAQFLQRESPLLMIEYWGDKKFNTEIFSPLQRHDYATYRLVPGIGVLAPFYESEEPDPYQLNLFACRAPRAAQLEGAGFLASAPATKEPRFAHEPSLDCLFALPFIERCAQSWRKNADQARRGSASANHMQALRRYFAAMDKFNSAAARLWALEHAYTQMRSVLAAEFTPARAASFVRIAAAYGQRAEAIEVNRRLVAAMALLDERILAEPFLMPWRYQETLAGGDDLSALLMASAVESYEHLLQFSSSDKTSLARESLNACVDDELLSPDYLRRENLFARRASALAGARN